MEVEGLPRREELDLLRGLYIGKPLLDLRAQFQEDDDDPYLFEYMHAEVRDFKSEGSIGVISSVETSAGQVLLWIQAEQGKFMLPLESNYFHSFDRKNVILYTTDMADYLSEVEYF